MPQEFKTLADLLAHGFDTVIDVRSPAEFAEDHIPGAVSMPAMSNDERARVGTIYKQISPFEAKKVGAAIVARNVASHIDRHMQQKNGSWKPLVYCWRGGQRSGSVAIILKQIGWRTDTIQGGYQTYRRLVHQALYDNEIPHRFILLDGNTGTAKTDVLKKLAAMGVQTLDLEGMANHRGSMLGAMGDQPSQKMFESRIACALAQLDPAKPVLVEAESSKIGKMIVPPMVWKAMCAAPRIDISAPLEARVDYLTRAYDDVTAAPRRLKTLIQPLRTFRGNETVDQWEKLLEAEDFPALAASLIIDHYDPAYNKSRSNHDFTLLATVEAAKLDDAGQTRLAEQIAEIVSSR